MSGLVDEFMKSLGPEVTKQLSSTLGIDKNAATQIIPQLAPIILGGLKRQKDDFGGQQRVDHILNKYGSASALDDIGGVFSKVLGSNAVDPRLGGLLGDSGLQATDHIANQFKLDGNIASKLIPMLAPMLLGFLTKKRDGGGGSSGLGSTGIESLLDQDGDGQILDDIAGFLLGGAMGGGSQQRSGGAGGLLGSLLGGLLGGRKR